MPTRQEAWALMDRYGRRPSPKWGRSWRDVAFHSAALVAFAATLMVLAIQERPAARRPPEVVAVAPASGA